MGAIESDDLTATKNENLVVFNDRVKSVRDCNYCSSVE